MIGSTEARERVQQRLSRVVGPLPQFQKDPLGFVARRAIEDPEIASLGSVFGREWLLLSSPDGVKHVFQDNHKNYGRGLTFKPLATLGSDNLPMLEGESWLHRRKTLQPVFNHKYVPSFVRIMQTCAERSVARLEQAAQTGERVDLAAELTRVTLDVVAEAVFGADIADDAADISTAVRTAFDYVNKKAMSLTNPPLWVPTSANRAFVAAQKTLDRVVYAMIEKRRRSNEERHDLLGLLLEARDEDGNALSDAQVHDEAIAFFMAGQETTATTLTWTFYLLGQHEDVRDQLESALLREDESARKSPFVRAVLLESMRLYPAAWLLTRTPLAPDVVCGRGVTPGTVVLVSPYAMHRSPHLFRDPLAFRPSRFLDDETGGSGTRFAYLPFGAGPRICIGKEFGMMEAAIVLGALARRFRFELDGPEVVAHAGFSMYPRDGLGVRVHARERSEARSAADLNV